MLIVLLVFTGVLSAGATEKAKTYNNCTEELTRTIQAE